VCSDVGSAPAEPCWQASINPRAPTRGEVRTVRRAANSRSRQREPPVGVPEDGENSRGQQLADDIVRLRNSLAFYRWWVWEAACALESAPEPYAHRSAYALWYRTRRSDALRGSRHRRCGRAHSALARIGCCTWCRPATGGVRKTAASVSVPSVPPVRLQPLLAAAQG
jgi:hypothetical protein